jgi:hypothetical protein
MGLSDQVRQTLIPKLPAAIQMLEDMRSAGMTPGESPLVEQVVVYVESDEERRTLREDSYEPVEAREATAAS